MYFTFLLLREVQNTFPTISNNLAAAEGGTKWARDGRRGGQAWRLGQGRVSGLWFVGASAGV